MEDLSMMDEEKIKLELYDIIDKMTLTEQVELLNKIKGFSSRRKKRSDVEIDVVFSVKDIDYRGLASNISFDGLFIQTDMVFNYEDSITVKLAGMDSPQDSAIKGEIVRITDDGIGVRLIRK